MARKKKKLTHEEKVRKWLEPKLRRLSYQWPDRKDSFNAAKVRVEDGFYKNGNPRFKTLIRCNSCEELFHRDEIQMDHVKPVVDVAGRSTWDNHIFSLLPEKSGWQPLCKGCHHEKTQAENAERRKNKKDK